AHEHHSEGCIGSHSRSRRRCEGAVTRERALRLYANNPGAHLLMGLLRRHPNRLPETRIEFETAIALDQNSANAFRQLGVTLMFMGQPQAAIPPIDKGVRLSPYDANIPFAYWALGGCDLLLGQINSLARWRAYSPWTTNPRFVALAETTLYLGLRRAGMPDE